MGGIDAEHVETKNEIHNLAVDRQHEQEVLASQLDGEEKKIKRIVRKLDFRLVLTLAVLYVWAFIDRGNLANVRNTHIGWCLANSCQSRPTLQAWALISGSLVTIDILSLP